MNRLEISDLIRKKGKHKKGNRDQSVPWYMEGRNEAREL